MSEDACNFIYVVADESVILQSMIATVTCAARAVGFLHQTPLALTVLYISVAM